MQLNLRRPHIGLFLQRTIEGLTMTLITRRWPFYSALSRQYSLLSSGSSEAEEKVLFHICLDAEGGFVHNEPGHSKPGGHNQRL